MAHHGKKFYSGTRPFQPLRVERTLGDAIEDFGNAIQTRNDVLAAQSRVIHERRLGEHREEETPPPAQNAKGQFLLDLK